MEMSWQKSLYNYYILKKHLLNKRVKGGNELCIYLGKEEAKLSSS
jgi:hypothetical protein